MVREIPLTQGFFALVDDADFERVNAHCWHVQKAHHLRYARTKIAGRRVCLHQFLLEITPGMEVDHKDGDGLNCQRFNMREVTHAANMQNRKIHKNNRTGFKGVGFVPRLGKWRARIKCDGPQRHLGVFSTAEDAARAYDAAARIAFGEMARLNLPLVSPDFGPTDNAEAA